MLNFMYMNFLDIENAVINGDVDAGVLIPRINFNL